MPTQDQTNQSNSNDTNERSANQSGKSQNSGKFQKGDQRAREAGRKGGQASGSRNS